MQAILLLFLCMVSELTALDNGLALTPPMGWLSWERFDCVTDCILYPDSCISERLIISQAEALVKLGLHKLGYEYVIIDDCWLASTRDNATGELVPNKERFPRGMPFLVDYVHNLGLKFGIYEDVGTKTCAGFPGSWSHMIQDADTFAKWKVDYVKLDGCNLDLDDMSVGYQHMGHYLNATNRPMVYSCSWPFYIWNAKRQIDYQLLMDTCNLWRNYFDIADSWTSIVGIIKFYSANQAWMAPLSGPGHWNDPDMVLVGDFSLSKGQSQVQFGMWAMFSAPLLLSVDLNDLPQYAVEIITNEDVIAVNQDCMGQQALLVYNSTNGIWSVFKKELGDSTYAVAILYLGAFGGPVLYKLNFELIDKTHSSFSVTDLFSKEGGVYTNSVSLLVDPNGIKLLKLTPA